MRFEVDEERAPADGHHRRGAVAQPHRPALPRARAGHGRRACSATATPSTDAEDVVDLGQLVNQLAPLAQAVSPDQINRILTTLLEAFDGNEATFDEPLARPRHRAGHPRRARRHDRPAARRLRRHHGRGRQPRRADRPDGRRTSSPSRRRSPRTTRCSTAPLVELAGRRATGSTSCCRPSADRPRRSRSSTSPCSPAPPPTTSTSSRPRSPTCPSCSRPCSPPSTAASASASASCASPCSPGQCPYPTALSGPPGGPPIIVTQPRRRRLMRRARARDAARLPSLRDVNQAVIGVVAVVAVRRLRRRGLRRRRPRPDRGPVRASARCSRAPAASARAPTCGWPACPSARSPASQPDFERGPGRPRLRGRRTASTSGPTTRAEIAVGHAARRLLPAPVRPGRGAVPRRPARRTTRAAASRSSAPSAPDLAGRHPERHDPPGAGPRHRRDQRRARPAGRRDRPQQGRSSRSSIEHLTTVGRRHPGARRRAAQARRRAARRSPAPWPTATRRSSQLVDAASVLLETLSQRRDELATVLGRGQRGGRHADRRRSPSTAPPSTAILADAHVLLDGVDRNARPTSTPASPTRVPSSSCSARSPDPRAASTWRSRASSAPSTSSGASCRCSSRRSTP